MSKVLIIGAGGVGGVVAHKCAMNAHVFTEIMLASRTKSKCDKIAADIHEFLLPRVKAQLPERVVKLFNDQTFIQQSRKNKRKKKNNK